MRDPSDARSSSFPTERQTDEIPVSFSTRRGTSWANERFFTGRKFDQKYERSLHNNAKGKISFVLCPSTTPRRGFHGAVVDRRRRELARNNPIAQRIADVPSDPKLTSLPLRQTRKRSRRILFSILCNDSDEEDEGNASDGGCDADDESDNQPFFAPETRPPWVRDEDGDEDDEARSTRATQGSQHEDEFQTPPTQPVEEDVDDSDGDPDLPLDRPDDGQHKDNEEGIPQDPVLSWGWESVVSTPQLGASRKSASSFPVKKRVSLPMSRTAKPASSSVLLFRAPNQLKQRHTQ